MSRPRYVREAHRALSAITVLLAKVRALQDEIADRANVEADLRAQLAETKAHPLGLHENWTTESLDQIEQAIDRASGRGRAVQ